MTNGISANNQFALGDYFWKLLAGAVLPCGAIIVFNLMNFFFDNFHAAKMPSPPESVYDIAIGSAFAVVGISVVEQQRSSKFLLLAFLILLLAILIEFVTPAVYGHDKLTNVVIMDVISFSALVGAIVLSQ
jgi:hypothetical protein